MGLNNIGKIADQCWQAIPSHHQNVRLDEYIIMPDHIHGILILFDRDTPVETLHATSLREDSQQRESETKSEYFSRISPKKGSLPSIIRSYKSAVTKTIRSAHNPTFAWQPRYYDHIIRTEYDLDNLRLYILLIQENWLSDNNENILMAVAHA